MVKRKRTKGQTTIYNSRHRKLHIGQHGVNSRAQEKSAVPSPLVIHVVLLQLQTLRCHYYGNICLITQIPILHLSDVLVVSMVKYCSLDCTVNAHQPEGSVADILRTNVILSTYICDIGNIILELFICIRDKCYRSLTTLSSTRCMLSSCVVTVTIITSGK